MFRKNIFDLKRAAKRLQIMRSRDDDLTTIMKDIGEVHQELNRIKKQ